MLRLHKSETFSILVLIPTKPNINTDLLRLSVEAECRMKRACFGLVDVVRDMRGPGDSHVKTLLERSSNLSTIRQEILEEYLRPHHTHVLAIDADIIKYDPMMPVRLLETSEKDIVAPMPLVDRTGPEELFQGHHSRFYDTAGFVENNQWCRIFPPFFNSTEEVVNLDGVGCFYMTPAEVFRQGGVYETTPGFTEHFSVCRRARELGLRVLCNTKLSVEHAWLPYFGEAYH